MPLFKGCGCKGKPAKAIDYITDEKKAAIVTSHALDDNRDYAQQFAETAKLFGKAQKYDSRKYYHFKHSFDPKDNITPEEAHRLTEELTQEVFPDNEYIIATHTDKDHIHCHIIVNSVSFVNGKMLHYSKDEYGRLKDRSNDIAAKYGYSTLDFRKLSADRIKSEERQIVLKGGTSWKEELREVIAEAKRLCNNMTEFEKHLNKYGVTITRSTAKTISYLHPQKKKPIRGIRLGQDYTKEAILYEFAKYGNRTTGTRKRTDTGADAAKQTGVRKQPAQTSVAGIQRAVDSLERRTKQLYPESDKADKRADEHRHSSNQYERAVSERHRKRVK